VIDTILLVVETIILTNETIVHSINVFCTTFESIFVQWYTVDIREQ